jgi:hypothetical protein
MLTPHMWLPGRLPYWGAILGLLAGIIGVISINVPLRLLALDVPFGWRVAVTVAMTVVYYIVWMFVRSAFRKLITAPPPYQFVSNETSMKKAA